MKNIFTVLLVAVLSLFATTSFAGNVYFSGHGGLSILQDADAKSSVIAAKTEFKPGFNAGGALGYDFGAFRTEFEIAYREFKIDNGVLASIEFPLSGPVTSTSFLINNYFDFESESSFTPYLGFGLGVARLTVDSTTPVVGLVGVDDSTTEFAYKLMAGSSYKVTSNFDLTFEYAFFGTTDPTFEDRAGADGKTEVHNHNINAGFKYNF